MQDVHLKDGSVRKTRILAFVAVLTASNVAFRFALSGGPPNVKPTAFLVIIAGAVSGPLPGFAVGWFSMMLSDMVGPFGAGIWTMETSAGMAFVGLLAGGIWHETRLPSRWWMACGGFTLTMIFDLSTSVVDALLFSYPLYAAVLGLYLPFLSGGISLYPFGIAHELTTAVLLAAFGPSTIARVRNVYR